MFTYRAECLAAKPLLLTLNVLYRVIFLAATAATLVGSNACSSLVVFGSL